MQARHGPASGRAGRGATGDGKHDHLSTDLLVDGEQEKDRAPEESDVDELAFGNLREDGEHDASWQLLESYWSMESLQ